MATERRILIYFDELVTSLVRTYKMTMNTHIYSPNDIISSMQGITPVDAVEVVHSRFVRIADFGDGEGCFGYCERCGTIHHAQHPVALKTDYRWCRWCGAKMDGDGNG